MACPRTVSRGRMLLVALIAFVARTSGAQQVELISKAAMPIETAGGSSPGVAPSVSDDGRFVVFLSAAPNLFAGQVDTNGVDDVFLRDRLSGVTVLVSHGASANTAASGSSAEAVISGDGAYVAFTSDASDVGSGLSDVNGTTDVFLYERSTGNISLVSHAASATTAGNLDSVSPAVSADGSVVVFASRATDLGSGFTDGNGGYDVFLYEKATGNLSLVSHAAVSTVAGNGASSLPVVDGNGGYVAFQSTATDLGSGITDPAANPDVFLYERASSNVTLVSHTSSPVTAGNGASIEPVLSRDGAYVAFGSAASDLGTGLTDTNASTDIFLYERASGGLSLVSHAASASVTANGSSNLARIGDDGNYVAFSSLATDLGAGFTDLNGTSDVFLFERTSGNIALVTHTSSPGVAGNSIATEVQINGNGNYVVLSSLADDLGSGLTDANFTSDVFLYERATGNLVLVSHTSSPTTAGNQFSSYLAMSRDGAVVAFGSQATDLGSGFADAAATFDTFDFERSTGTVDLLSRAVGTPSGSAAGVSTTLSFSSMSDDSRFVVFVSTANNLVPGQVDTNDAQDVFLYDRSIGQVTLVSHAASFTRAGNDQSSNAVISGDGNWIAFESRSNDLGIGLNDVNSGSDVYLYDRATGNISVVSHTSSSTTTGGGFSTAPSISLDGRFVAFQSTAANLGPGFSDANSADDVFVYDRVLDTIALVSHASTTTTTGNGRSQAAMVSRDGAYVAFESVAANLGTGITDTNARQDVFLYERATGNLALVSHTTSATTTANDHSYVSSISSDGRTTLFQTGATDVGSGITNTNGNGFDLFLFDRLTTAITLVSHSAASSTTTGNGASHTADMDPAGRLVAFMSAATNLSAGVTDSNSRFDVFLYDASTGIISLVSHTTSLTTTGNAGSDSAVISRDGSRVAFRTEATNLIGGYVGTYGLFLYDRLSGGLSLLSHVPTSLTVSGNGYSERPVIGDGSWVAFSSYADDLVSLDLNVLEDAFLASSSCSGTTLTATPNGDNRIDLSWTAPGAYTYQVLRSRTAGGPYDVLGSVSGTSFIDTTAEGGIAYYYVVSDACGTSNEASATTSGACLLPPDFAGATIAIQTGSASCEIRVDWLAATAPCGGTSSYTVYRDTSPGFVPGPSNRLVTGLASNPYLDGAAILPATTYYYVVRATSDVNGEEDANLVEVSETPMSCTPSAPAPVTFFNVRSGDSENVLDWVNPMGAFTQTHITVTTDGSTPVCTGTPVSGSPFAGTAGSRDRVALPSVNGTTYRYAACAEASGSGLSSPQLSFGRPDSTAGNWKWSYTTGAAALSLSGVIPNGAYYVVSNDKVLHGLAPGTGGGSWPLGPPVWFPFPTNAPVQGRPTVLQLSATTVSGASKIALIGSQDGHVYAVDAESGAPLWTSPLLGAAVQASPAALLKDFGGSYDLVLVGTREPAGDSKFYALHLATGLIAWTFDNGGGANAIGIISAQAQVDYTNQRLYFTSRPKNGGSSHTLWCLSFTDSGVNLVWSENVGGADSSPVLAGGRLYVGNNAGEVRALNPSDGTALWASPFSTSDGAVKGFVWPDVATGRLYFATTGSVHAIHDDGGSASPFWGTPVSIASPSFVLLRNGRLYVGGGSSRVYSIDATSPSPAAPTSVVLGDPLVPKVIGAPTLDVTSDLILVGSDLGVIFAVAIPF